MQGPVTRNFSQGNNVVADYYLPLDLDPFLMRLRLLLGTGKERVAHRGGTTQAPTPHCTRTQHRTYSSISPSLLPTSYPSSHC